MVAFRVSLEVYKELEKIKAMGGLSYADLIKLGAGFAQDEIKANLAQISGLENRLAELSSAIEREQQRLNESLDEETRRRLEELDLEIKAFKLFDRRWSIEQVSFKLAFPKDRLSTTSGMDEGAKEQACPRARATESMLEEAY